MFSTTYFPALPGKYPRVSRFSEEVVLAGFNKNKLCSGQFHSTFWNSQLQTAQWQQTKQKLRKKKTENSKIWNAPHHKIIHEVFITMIYTYTYER